jgi:hypothetical protein
MAFEYETSSSRSKSGRATRFALFGGFVAVLCFLIGYTWSPDLHQHLNSSSSSSLYTMTEENSFDTTDTTDSTDTMTSTTSTTSSGDGSEILVYNDYTKFNPIKYYPWSHMAEPERVTYLEANIEEESGYTYRYTWYVNDHIQDYGRVIEMNFPEVGDQSVVLEVSKSGKVETYEVTVKVKYVRREIRSLTDKDREMFFNAVSIMQRVPTSVGQKIWGTNYKSKDYFNRVHLYYGGTADCDHWHQGAGFVTSHMTFTLEYEQSVQAIFPSMTVPYWDFTLESTFYDPGSWRSSPVFSADWFGEANPDNELHTVTEGRFAYVPALTKADKFTNMYNSYGVMRASWNADPTPFMTRSGKVYGYDNNIKPSGCAEYSRALRKTTWMSMSKQLNSAAHGHIHELMGGSWGNDFFTFSGGQEKPAILDVAHSIQALSKELWRVGFVTCPENCSMDTSAADCSCEKDMEAIEGKSFSQMLDEAGALSTLVYYDNAGHEISDFYDDDGVPRDTIPGYSTEQTQKMYEDVFHILSQPGHIGSMFQATSTNDITFWVLHPMIDRLWHWKRLGEEDLMEGTSTFDQTWDPFHTCYGHNPDNLQPFSNLFDDDHDNFYTNTELYQLLHPKSDTLPYVYDNFNWAHCEVIGYDFGFPPTTSS